MKKLLLLLFSTLISFNSYGDSPYETICVETEALMKNGMIYLPNKTKPFTGKDLCKNENGQIKTEGKVIKGGFVNQTFYSYHENGQIWAILAEENYKDDKKNSKFTSWYQNGQIRSEGNYKNRNQDGEWVFWYDNNLKYEDRTYKDGVLIYSTRYRYFDNGQIETELKYQDDRLNGKVSLWHKNGQKFIDGNYKDGRPDSKWTYWKKNGQKYEERNYQDGDLVDKTIFKYSYFTGHLKSEKKYKD